MPEDIFIDLDSLYKLRVQKNRLEELHPLTFYKLRNLNILDLSDNLIQFLPWNIFYTIYELTLVNLSSNRLKILPVQLLNEQDKLEEFDISKNQLHTINNGTFANLFKLKRLNLFDNLIGVYRLTRYIYTRWN